MITFNKKRNAVRRTLAVLACVLSFSAVSSAIPVDPPVPVPVFTAAAFSQSNSGMSPTRLFTTDLNVFTLDISAKRVKVWRNTNSGNQIRSFSGIADIANSVGSKGYTFTDPRGLAKHPTLPVIAITDKGVSAQRVVFYSYTESETAVTFTYIGAYSNLEWAPNPVDVAFYPDGDVAVCGSVYNTFGAYAIRLTGTYDALSPLGNIFDSYGSTADGLDIDPISGNVFITSASDHCVYEYAGFSLLRTYGVPGVSGTAMGSLNGPGDAAVWRPEGAAPKLLVADTLNNRIVVFNLIDGNSVFLSFGTSGTWSGQFNKPNSVYAGKRIAVADTFNRRVQLFELDMTNVANVQITGDTVFEESATEMRTLLLTIFEIPTNDIVFEVTGYLPGAVEGPATLTVLAGTNTAELDFWGLDGPANCTLTFTQSPAGTFKPASFSFSVRNVAPTIIDSGADAYSVNLGGSLVFFGLATDPSTNDVLTYEWTFSDGSGPLYGSEVTNMFSVPGIVTVTLTVSDGDGGADSDQFDMMVQDSETVSIVFTAISDETVSFQVPTDAKSNDFLVKIAPVLSLALPDWTDWLLLPETDLVAGGPFTADMLIAPFAPVNVISVDEIDGMTTVTFDITSLYATDPHFFFRVFLQN